jgi:hypothetical protein
MFLAFSKLMNMWKAYLLLFIVCCEGVFLKLFENKIALDVLCRMFDY